MTELAGTRTAEAPEPGATVPASGAAGRRMTQQLVLVELRRLLRNLYLWAAVAAVLALLIWGHWNQLPNLAQATVNGAMATFLVAATLMVLANLATLRDQRHGMPETLGALPGRADARTRAVLVAAGGLGAVLAGGILGVFLLVRLTQGTTAGHVDAREVLAAVASAAIMASFGVALGRWLPSLVAAPVILGVFAMSMFVGVAFLLAWYLPVTAPYELQVYGRPTGLRLLYLLGVLILVPVLAMLRHGRRPLRLGAAAAALAIMVPAGIAIAVAAPPQIGTAVSSEERAAGEPDLECKERNRVDYCHLPGFGSWIPLWAKGVDPIVAALPASERDRLPSMTQRSDWSGPTVLDAGEVVIDLSWGRGDAELGDRTQLAGRVAGLVTGLTDPTRTYPIDQDWCDARGQARTVVTLWLAGQAAPVQPATPAEAWGGGYIEESYLGSRIGYGEREVGYAEALLAREDAREQVAEHWDTLVDPDTSIDAALPLLGLPERFPAEQLKERPCD